MDFSQSLSSKIMPLAVGLLMLTFAAGCQGQVRDSQAQLAQAPRVDQRLVDEDFAFPSKPPSLARGRELFQNQCASCHASTYWQQQRVKENVAYTTPIDTFLFLTTGHAPDVVLPNQERRQVLPADHPAFKEAIPNRDDRWAVIFYARYLAGAGDMPDIIDGVTVASSFGGNCAVCHGKSGRADGPLHLGKTGNHDLHDARVVHNLLPAPADFRQYDRMYNRTDAQIFKYICQGIYPSAMPSWYGNVDRDFNTGKVQYVFDDDVIWRLVRHVRSLAYTNDLDANMHPEAKSPPPGLSQLLPCGPVPQNRPWTTLMREHAPNKAFASYEQPLGNPITGGLTLPQAPAAASPEGLE